MRPLVGALVLTSLATLACGGDAEPSPVMEPVQPVVKAPAASVASVTLLVATRSGARCAWGLLTLPQATTVQLAEGSCEPPFLATNDAKVFLAGDTLIDLTTHAATVLPPVPGPGGELELGPGGAPIALASEGYGEETWGEGPSWEHTVSTAWKLEGGAWVEAGSYDDGAPKADRKAYDAASKTDSAWLVPDEGPDCELDAEPFREVLEAAGGTVDRWCVDRLPAPRVAWGLLQSEASIPVGPILVSTGVEWSAAPDLGLEASAVDLRGTLLIAEDGGEAVVYDLDTRSALFRGLHAMFLPGGVAR